MLTNLRLRNFRCFEGVSVDIGPGFNLFLGANGEGKTTILEAACVLLRLQSQRSSSLVPVIQISKKFFEVRGRFEEHELEFRYSALKRRVKFDEIEQRTLREYLRIGRVVPLANAGIELVTRWFGRSAPIAGFSRRANRWKLSAGIASLRTRPAHA